MGGSTLSVLTQKAFFFDECSNSWADEKEKEPRMQEVDDLIKMTLLANLTFDEAINLTGDHPKTWFQLLNKLVNLEASKILDKIEEDI
ncbi:MAG: hypothetical protein QXF13_01865 [Thermoproteota archaeon]